MEKDHAAEDIYWTQIGHGHDQRQNAHGEKKVRRQVKIVEFPVEFDGWQAQGEVGGDIVEYGQENQGEADPEDGLAK